MSLDDILTLFQEKSSGVDGFGGRIRLDVDGEGSLMLDGSGDNVEVSSSDDEADTTIGLDMDTLKGLIEGDLNPAMAFMTGKLAVSGNMGLAMKLQGMIGDD